MKYYMSKIINGEEVSLPLLNLRLGPDKDEGYLSIGWSKLSKDIQSESEKVSFCQECKKMSFDKFQSFCQDKKIKFDNSIKQRSLYNFLNLQCDDIIVVPHPKSKFFSIVKVIGATMPVSKLSEVSELSSWTIAGSELRYQDNGIVIGDRNKPLDIGFVIKVKVLKTILNNLAGEELKIEMSKGKTPKAYANRYITNKEIDDSEAKRQIQQALEQSDIYGDGEKISNMNSENAQLVKQLANNLLNSKNIILRGAPGTGKTYLAKQIAADIISCGECDDYEKLSTDQKKQIEFVQFHPSYDYTDFVEGLRPVTSVGENIGFELKPGVFKNFVSQAIKNYNNSRKTQETVEKEYSVQEAMAEFFANLEPGSTFKNKTGNEFSITDVDDLRIYISIPGNATSNKLRLSIDNIRKMLESDKDFKKVKDIADFFGKQFSTQNYSYEFVLYEAIRDKIIVSSKDTVKPENLKYYVFIIDEINRGEISKIFGELFFSIDPGYRGPAGGVKPQYANLHDDENEKFYIPENVYIIGTMNDIDRSVDSFDFAMRRRFRFVEIKVIEEASDNQSKKDDNQKLYKISRNTDIILDSLKDKDNRSKVEERIINLNKAISNTPGLNANYHIGAAYFLKLNDDGVTFNVLWDDYLEPLLQEYVRGMSDEKEIMIKFKDAYNKSSEATAEDPKSDNKP